MSNGNYPAGAANDRSAPFNQSSETCPKCEGKKEIDDFLWGGDYAEDGTAIGCWTKVDCDLCEGTGEADAAAADEYLREQAESREEDEDDD